MRSTALLLIVSLLVSQTPLTSNAQGRPQVRPTTVTVTAGTIVPLTLVNQIKNKSSKPGDAVRAVVAFPVTVGTQLAIPTGTYVEGTLLPPAPKVKHQPDKGVQIHFTRLVFANGYSAPLDATQSAELIAPASAQSSQGGFMALSAAAFASFDPASIWSAIGFRLPTLQGGWRSWLMAPQTTPPALPPLPHNGLSPSVIGGLTIGVIAAGIILGILFHHSSRNSDYIVHDAGWQFQMKLDAPITVDTSLIAPKKP